MRAHGMWDDVLVMTYAEFGRRPKENGSGGTDRGTSAPHFLMGGRVKGGLYGEQPPLDDLVHRDNLQHRLIRSLYATVAQEWWAMNASFLKEPPLGAMRRQPRLGGADRRLDMAMWFPAALQELLPEPV